MSRYNTIIQDDVVNGQGICTSFFVQGCPHQCVGCFNPETWTFNGGLPYDEKVKEKIVKSINANGILRNFSVLGGEPLTKENLEMTAEVVRAVRQTYPNITIFLWTGYYFEQLPKKNPFIKSILNDVNIIIDGPFLKDEKNLNLRLRGSNNQRIWRKENPNLWERVE